MHIHMGDFPKFGDNNYIIISKLIAILCYFPTHRQKNPWFAEFS